MVFGLTVLSTYFMPAIPKLGCTEQGLELNFEHFNRIIFEVICTLLLDPGIGPGVHTTSFRCHEVHEVKGIGNHCFMRTERFFTDHIRVRVIGWCPIQGSIFHPRQQYVTIAMHT